MAFPPSSNSALSNGSSTSLCFGKLILFKLGSAFAAKALPSTRTITPMTRCPENAAAPDVRLLPGTMDRMESLINANTVSGPRYNATTLPEIDALAEGIESVKKFFN